MAGDGDGLLVFLFEGVGLHVVVVFLVIVGVLTVVVFRVFRYCVSSIFYVIRSVSRPFYVECKVTRG